MPTGSFFYLDTRRNWHQVRLSDEKLLGRGGAGHVYALSDDKVVKRYLTSFLTDKKREELRDKITVMAFRHQQLAALNEQPLAWPLGPLIESKHDFAWLRSQAPPQLDSNEFRGFVMRRVGKYCKREVRLADSVEKPILIVVFERAMDNTVLAQARMSQARVHQ